jgi:hypothetical protein
MELRRLLSLVLLAVALTVLAVPGVAGPPMQTSEPVDELSVLPDGTSETDPFDPKQVLSPSAASAVPYGGIIEVATDSNDDELSPAVAQCAFGQYLVVWANDADDEIYGQRLDGSGNLVGGRFQITPAGSYPASNPDVACDWASGRFVVVWQVDHQGQGVDDDLRVQRVHGWHQTGGSQLYGSSLRIADSFDNEKDPAIACNSSADSCLVVFEFDGSGNGDILGQRVSVGDANLGFDGDSFNVHASPSEQYNPDVAWGGLDDNYLVAWQQMRSTPSDHYRIAFNHVHDTEQGPGADETQHGGTWLISAAEWTRDQTTPAVAYNCADQRYLVVFTHDVVGDGSDYDIAARRVKGTGAVVTGDQFYVAWDLADETSPTVDFVGGPQPVFCGGGDQFLIVYILRGPQIVLSGQVIRGTHNSSGSQLVDNRVRIRTKPSSTNFGLWNPHVTGSDFTGRYLVVWQDMTGGVAGQDHDVLGKLVAPHGVFLPLVPKNHSP